MKSVKYMNERREANGTTYWVFMDRDDMPHDEIMAKVKQAMTATA